MEWKLGEQEDIYLQYCYLSVNIMNLNFRKGMIVWVFTYTHTYIDCIATGHQKPF